MDGVRVLGMLLNLDQENNPKADQVNADSALQKVQFVRIASSSMIPFAVQLKHPFHIWYHWCFNTLESGNGDNIGCSHIPLALYPPIQKSALSKAILIPMYSECYK